MSLLPPPPAGNASLYLKLRDRASYEFALASAAIVVHAAQAARFARPRCSGRRRHQAVALLRSRARTDGAKTPNAGNFPRRSGSRVARRAAAEPERIQNRTRQALPRPRSQTRHAIKSAEIKLWHSPKRHRSRIRQGAGPHRRAAQNHRRCSLRVRSPLSQHAVCRSRLRHDCEGKITAIDTARARQMPGVLLVLQTRRLCRR